MRVLILIVAQQVRPARREPAPEPGRFATPSAGFPRVEPGRSVLPTALHAHAGVGALDWETGVELKGHLFGNLSSLELHHIFPKARLYEAGYGRSQVNALANFTFLTKETNLTVSAKNPATYLAAYAEKDPALLSSHWIPLEPRPSRCGWKGAEGHRPRPHTMHEVNCRPGGGGAVAV